MVGPHFHHLFKKIIHAVTLGRIIRGVLTSLPFLGLLNFPLFIPLPFSRRLFLASLGCQGHLPPRLLSSSLISSHVLLALQPSIISLRVEGGDGTAVLGSGEHCQHLCRVFSFLVSYRGR